SPLQGWFISHFDPRLAPWASLWRRSAAKKLMIHSTTPRNSEFSRTHWSRGGARGEFDRKQLRLCLELARVLGKKVQLADGGTGGRSALRIVRAVQRDRPNLLLVLPFQTHATTQRN